jgi:hypothetical protein
VAIAIVTTRPFSLPCKLFAGHIGHNFEKDPPKNHTCQFLLNFVFREEGLNVKFYDGTTDGCQVIAKVHIAFDLLNSVQDLLLLDSSNRTRPTRCRSCRYRNRKRSGEERQIVHALFLMVSFQISNSELFTCICMSCMLNLIIPINVNIVIFM